MAASGGGDASGGNSTSSARDSLLPPSAPGRLRMYSMVIVDEGGAVILDCRVLHIRIRDAIHSDSLSKSGAASGVMAFTQLIRDHRSPRGDRSPS